MYDTPEALRRAAWDLMARGVADKHSPARHPTLATIGPDGPRQRTVVLRGWQGDTAEMHTDAASAKTAELRADPRAALHVWHSRHALQVRLSGRVEIVQSDPDRWARVPGTARAVYGGHPEPGVPLATPDAFTPAPSLERFAALRLRVCRVDVVHLGRDLHRRVIFARTETGWQGGWVAP